VGARPERRKESWEWTATKRVIPREPEQNAPKKERKRLSSDAKKSLRLGGLLKA